MDINCANAHKTLDWGQKLLGAVEYSKPPQKSRKNYAADFILVLAKRSVSRDPTPGTKPSLIKALWLG